MREAVDAGLEQPLRIFQLDDVRGHPQAMAVGFVDHGAIERGVELLVLAPAIVDPDLDHVDLPRGELLHGLPRLGFGLHPVGHFGSSWLGRGDSAARGQQTRAPGNRLEANLQRVVSISCRDSAARLRRSRPCAEGCRQAGPAFAVHARACRSFPASRSCPPDSTRAAPAGALTCSAAAHLHNAATLDHEDGVLDGARPVTGDQSSARRRRWRARGTWPLIADAAAAAATASSPRNRTDDPNPHGHTCASSVVMLT